ncbi:Cadmium-induced protein AS [Trema orientale]|uniref:Cadmium-induced protein AS n=1 Tax=Trema orientale TaxID=63057 RepID=A0A2P5FA78_TREOI|nr:Cadmium-induced protein AS [Trema orientale]
MIIKGLFRRYERWNPVHPTYGAFWGMGIGIGCGVGWGPGFGPEVVGYVGAGCGIGFSVGFTIVGFGVGLPANYIFGIPYNAFTATRSVALEISRSNGFLFPKSVAGDGWTITVPHISDLQREASGRLSSFKQKVLLEKGLSSFDVKSLLPGHSKWPSVGEFHKQLFRNQKGSQD